MPITPASNDYASFQGSISEDAYNFTRPKPTDQWSSGVPTDLNYADTDTAKDPNYSELTKSYQLFFNVNHPVIGKLYNGPIDGIKNDALAAASKQAESIISGIISNPKVIGTIWNNGPVTTVADIFGAIQVIVNYQKNKKSV